MTLGTRLQQALDLRRRDAASLYTALGFSKGAIYNILNDTTKAEKVWASTAIAICRELDVNIEWFVLGKGNPENRTSIRPELAEVLAQLERLNPAQLNAVANMVNAFLA
jgi:DNA-binding Xre family transcriptional regulator